MKLRILSLILSIILVLLLAGCNSTDDAYIYFELPHLPATLDPQTAESTAELLIIRNIFEGLMRVNEKNEVVNGAAESYTKNGLTYTFKLRKNAKWSNGDSVTAEDFLYGLKRALTKENNAPFASRLFSIKNAEGFYNGTKTENELGIDVVNSTTLNITLAYEDDTFLKNLSTSVAMPCNEEFFLESKGKYGLFSKNIICNGSYRLTKWNKEVFGIRLYRNEEYTGNFYAKNAAVFLTCSSDEEVTQKLKENDIDIAFIGPENFDEMEALGFETTLIEDTCWVMTFNNTLSQNMRLALIKAINREYYSENLPTGHSLAMSLYPDIIMHGRKIGNVGVTAYDLEGAKELFKTEVKKLEDNKFPSGVILYYYDNGISKSVVTDILGHWQSNLTAFVNIEAIDSSDTLLPQLQNQTLPIAVFPISAKSANEYEYLKSFGTKYANMSLAEAQSELLKNNSIIPLFFESTAVCHNQSIKEIAITSGDGFIDFSLIVKESD